MEQLRQEELDKEKNPPDHCLHLSDTMHGERQLCPTMVFHQCQPQQCNKSFQHPQRGSFTYQEEQWLYIVGPSNLIQRAQKHYWRQCYNLNPLFTFPHTNLSDDSLLSRPCTYVSQSSSFDSLLSWPCTLSHDNSTMTHNHPYLRNIYIDLGARCNNLNLALLNYTWVPGQSSSWNIRCDISILLRYIITLWLSYR